MNPCGTLISKLRTLVAIPLANRTCIVMKPAIGKGNIFFCGELFMEFGYWLDSNRLKPSSGLLGCTPEPFQYERWSNTLTFSSSQLIELHRPVVFLAAAKLLAIGAEWDRISPDSSRQPHSGAPPPHRRKPLTYMTLDPRDISPNRGNQDRRRQQQQHNNPWKTSKVPNLQSGGLYFTLSFWTPMPRTGT